MTIITKVWYAHCAYFELIYRLLGSPETRSLIFLIKNSPDQVEGYLDYLQPRYLQCVSSFPFELGSSVQSVRVSYNIPNAYIKHVLNIPLTCHEWFKTWLTLSYDMSWRV
jgi:hypothetical protein